MRISLALAVALVALLVHKRAIFPPLQEEFKMGPTTSNHTVVLLHGLFADPSQTKILANMIYSRDRSVRIFGWSTFHPFTERDRTTTNVLQSRFMSMTSEKITLVGFSMGGLVGYNALTWAKVGGGGDILRAVTVCSPLNGMKGVYPGLHHRLFMWLTGVSLRPLSGHPYISGLQIGSSQDWLVDPEGAFNSELGGEWQMYDTQLPLHDHSSHIPTLERIRDYVLNGKV